MTNSELFENLFKLKETYKKEIESLTTEQFLNNDKLKFRKYLENIPEEIS